MCNNKLGWWVKNWLLSAYCQIFLSTEEMLVELWWHVYQNEVNVDQNESYRSGRGENAQLHYKSFYVQQQQHNQKYQQARAIRSF